MYLPVIWGGGAPTSTPTPTVTKTPSPTPTATPAWIAIVEEGFEGSFPAGWEAFDNAAGNGEYYWAKRDCRAYEGSHSAWAVGGGADGAALPCMSQFPDRTESWMVYGPFSLEQAEAAEMSVMLWLGTPQDFAVSLCASFDGYFGCRPIVGAVGLWQEHRLDLAAVPGVGNLLGAPQVWVALRYKSSWSGGLEGAYADNVLVRQLTH